MQIQALSSANSTLNCQPIKPVNFERKNNSDIQNIILLDDTYTPDNTSVLEQKYDFACQLAAYYKDQYESLLKSGYVDI